MQARNLPVIWQTGWMNKMPTHLPDDFSSKQPRVKIVAAQETRHDSEIRTPRAKHRLDTIDWLAIWSLSIALSALVVAAVVYDVDKVGASAVLAGAAGVIAMVLLLSEAPIDHD